MWARQWNATEMIDYQEQRYLMTLKLFFFHSNHTPHQWQTIYSGTWEFSSFLESSSTPHLLATSQVPGTKEHNSVENNTGVEGGRNISNCDEEWQTMDSEVSDAGCSLGRKQRLQWVQRVAFKWSLAQKKCREYRPSPVVASGRTKLGSEGAGGAWSWPLPSLPILFLSLLWTPTCTFSSFLSYLVVTKTWTKSFLKERNLLNAISSIWFLCACLFACLFTISWRQRASFHMQLI